MSEAARDWSSEVKDLGDKIMDLTLLKAQELGDYLKEVHGVEAAAAHAPQVTVAAVDLREVAPHGASLAIDRARDDHPVQGLE